VERYIGVENELFAFMNGEFVCIDTHFFDKIKRRVDYRVDRTNIITHSGNKYYIDSGGILEIVTPPIEVNRGFATRLTNSIILGRNHIIESLPNLKFTGYSMHWNISKGDYRSIGQDISIPFHLFGLNPLSVGFKVRDAGDRYEIMGESLVNNNQINALALLLGSYSVARDSRSLQVKTRKRFVNGKQHDFFLNSGRRGMVEVWGDKKIRAQKYLENFYEWVYPEVKEFGTKREIGNLEEFVFQRRPLEIDDIDFFNEIKKAGGKRGRHYLPIEVGDGRSLILKKGGRASVPREGKNLSAIISQKRYIYNFDFDILTLRRDVFAGASGIGEVYKFGEKLRKNGGRISH